MIEITEQMVKAGTEAVMLNDQSKNDDIVFRLMIRLHQALNPIRVQELFHADYLLGGAVADRLRMEMTAYFKRRWAHENYIE